MEDIKKLVDSWNSLLLRAKLQLNLSDLAFSALSSWIVDCHKSFHRIYSQLLLEIDSDHQNDIGLLHDCISEIYFDLQHIQEHIKSSESGFLELLRVVAMIADTQSEGHNLLE